MTANSTRPLNAAERTQRLEAVEFARLSVRLEGIVLSEAVELINQRFIDGELTRAEHTDQCLEAMEREAQERRCRVSQK